MPVEGNDSDRKKFSNGRGEVLAQALLHFTHAFNQFSSMSHRIGSLQSARYASHTLGQLISREPNNDTTSLHQQKQFYD